MAKQKTRKTPAIETVNIGAAAVDIGSREHMAAVNPDVTDALGVQSRHLMAWIEGE